MREAKKLSAEKMRDFDLETASASRLKFCSEMKIIKPLPDDVRNCMRSGVILFDMTRVVEELIFNSLDSGATKVSIFVGVDTCCIKVVDDGCGVSRDGLEMLGDRYATSKRQDFADMELSSKNLGFRGEALAAISDISVVEIATKAIGRPNGYRKVMKGSKCIYLGIDDDQKEVGTTVVVRDLFYNQPVRRKYMRSSPKRVLLSIKKCVLQIALIHHRICFNLFDIESEEELFRMNSSSSPLPLLMNASGIPDLTSLHRVNASEGTIKISGYLSKPEDSFGSKGFQYLYINSRFIGKCSIHKLLSQLAISYNYSDQWKTSGVPQRGKRSRPQANPSYILNLICSRCLYDLTFEPSRTCVEFKDWGPILTFVEKVVQALWKKDITLESVGGGQTITLQKDNASFMSAEEDIMESRRTKRRKQNHQTSTLFLSDDPTKDGDYFFDGNFEWTPCLELEEEIRGVEEQDLVGEYLEEHRRSSWGLMTVKEDFPLVDYTEDFLVTNNTCRTDSGVRKQSEESGFLFDKFDDGLDVGQIVRKPFLHGCTSREDILFEERIVPPTNTGSCKTKREGLFSDGDSVIVEFQARSMSLDCSPGALKEVEDLFCLEHPKERNMGKMETDYDTFFTDPVDLNLSSEGRSIRDKLESASQPENFDCNSSYHHVNLSSETMWDTDCFTSSGLYGSSRWLRRPNHDNLAADEDDNLILDDAIMSEIPCRENSMVEFSNSCFSMKDYTNSCQFDKFLKRDNLDGFYFQGTDSVLADQMGRHSRLANQMGIDSHDIQSDTFRHKDSEQNSVSQTRPRRSLSAPPFYCQKKRFVSLSHCRPLFSAATDDGDENHLQKSCGASHVQLKPDFTKQRMKIEMDVASIKNSAMELGRSLHSQPREEAQVTDIVLEEIQGPLNSFTKWRHNSLLDTAKAPRMSCEVQDQDSVLDISSESLRNLAGASLVPDMNRNLLQDAKALQQVDKKFIPVVSGGKLAIIDQHAADERIRLEELRREVLSGKEKRVTYLDAEEELILPEMGYQLLQSYADQIKDWGWICHINGQGPKSFKKNMDILSRQPTTVTLIAVPCILGVNLTDADLSEFLQQLADTDGSSTIPPSVLRILNSKACRGAIMFGDTLLPSECSLIVEELKQTSLCFQCAHGRPTTVPVVDMKTLQKQITKIGSKKSWHGLDRHEITLDRAKMRLHAAQC